MALGYCPSLLLGIANAIKRNPVDVMDKVGFLQSLHAPENTSNVVQEYNPESGHNKNVTVKYFPRGVIGNVSTGPFVCAPGTHTPYREAAVTTTLRASVVVGVDEKEVAKYCEEASKIVDASRSPIAKNTPMMEEHIMRIVAQLEGLRQRVNLDLLTQLLTKFGGRRNGGSSASQTVNVIRSADDSIVLKGWNAISRQLAEQGLSQKPAIVGFGNFRDFVSALEIGCCNDAGQDFGKMAGSSKFNFWEDMQFDAAIGNNQIVAYAPGSLQHIVKNDFKGAFGGTKPNGVTRAIFPDPHVPGLSYDMEIDYVSCGAGNASTSQYNITFRLQHDLFATPTDAFQVGDPLLNTNGVLRFTAAAI